MESPANRFKIEISYKILQKKDEKAVWLHTLVSASGGGGRGRGVEEGKLNLNDITINRMVSILD